MQLKDLANLTKTLQILNKSASIADTFNTLSLSMQKAILTSGQLSAEQLNLITTSNIFEPSIDGEMIAMSGLTLEEVKIAVSTGALSASQAGATTSTLGLGTAFKGLGISIKNAAKSMWAFMSTNPIGWLIGIGAAVYGVVKLYDLLTVSLEEQKKKLQETKEAYENVKSELQEIDDELQNAKNRIEELENTPNLTWVEQAELDRLHEVTKELELQKKLKQDEQLKAAEDLYRENEKTFNKEFKNSYGSTSVEEVKQKLASGDSTLLFLDENNPVDMIAGIQYLKEAKKTLTDENEIKEYDDIIDSMVDKLKEKYPQYLSSLSNYKQNILEIASIRELTEDEQAFYDYITSIQKMIYEIYDPATWNSFEFDSIFDTDGIEKTKEELIALQKAGKLSPEVLQGYPKLCEAIEESGIIAGEESDVFKEFYNEIAALADKQEDMIVDGFEEIIPTISSSISTIATQLEPQFTELGKLYNEIFQTDGNGNKVFSLDSMDNAALESLRKSFAEIGEEIGVTFDPAQLETFFEVLTNGGSEQEVQQAFNDLATAYLYSTGTLEQLNNETANAIEQQLEQMGVTNAEAVVAEALRVKNEELALSKEYLAQYSKELGEATDSEVLAFMAEQAEAGNCGKELAALQLQKLLINGTLLDTETDINNVMRLAQSAGIATESLAELITLKAACEKAETEGYTNTIAYSMIVDRMKTLKQDFQNEVNSLEFNPVDIEFNAPDSSKSAASSSAAKQAETDWKNVLDKETDLLEKQLAANVITFKEYTDKRRQIIEDYYRDGRIKAEEYYDALESMYGSQLSLYDKVVNAVTDRIDDEIDRLNEQKEAIENFYQVRIDAIQEEIDALNKANDARQNQIDLEKAQYEAERARNQHVNKVYDGSQFVYAADMEAVRDAEDDLADKDFRLNISRLETQIESLKEEMENATKSLDNQIDALKTYKDKWSEISDVYQRQQDKLLAAEIMGSEWERDVLNGRLDTLRSFTEQYIALQQAQADAAVNAARIKAEAEAGSTTGGNVGNRNTDSNNGNVNAGSKGGLFKQTFETIGETINEGLTKTIDKGLAKTTEKLFASLKEKTTSVEKSKGIAGETLYYAKKYASGTDNAKKGLNLVGEDGTETFIDNDGNVALVTKPTLIPMEGGEVVKNTEETKAMLDTGNIELVQSEGMRALFERIRNMQPSDFSFQSLMQPLSAMVSFPNMDYSHMLHNTSAEPTPVVQHITLTLPNVTNNSGADYLIKTLERLPLDNLQHMHKRKR